MHVLQTFLSDAHFVCVDLDCSNKTKKVGWSPSTVSTTGEQFVKTLVSALWCLDPHHQQFIDWSIHHPLAFTIFTGYNDWKRKKIKKPRLSNEDLKQHEDKLSSLLSQPWFARKVFESVRLDTEGLLHAIHKYIQYLKHTLSVGQVLQSRPQALHSSWNVVLGVISAAASLPREVPVPIAANCVPPYQAGKCAYRDLSIYKPNLKRFDYSYRNVWCLGQALLIVCYEQNLL
ncbi:hypothetical protein EMCRGX_G022018 [Ephydatia muelleri]